MSIVVARNFGESQFLGSRKVQIKTILDTPL